MSESESFVDTGGTFEETVHRAAAAGACRIKILRGIGEDQDHLETIDAADYDLEELRRRWGGGAYKLELRGPQGQYIRRQSEKLHGDPLHSPYGRDDEEEELEEAPAGYVTMADFQDLAGRLEKGLKDAIADVRANAPRYNEAATSPLDPMTMALSLMQGMQGMVDTAIDPLRKELRRREDRDREKDGGTQQGFVQGVEFAAKLAPTLLGTGGDGTGGAPSSLDRLSGVLIDLIQNRAIGGGAPRAGPLPSPEPGTPPDAPADSGLIDRTKLSVPPPFWVQVLEGSLEDLLGWAGQGKDPELCAAWSLDGIPPAFYARIQGELERPGMREELYRTTPAAAAARSWLDEYFTELSGLLKWELEGDQEEATVVQSRTEVDPGQRPRSADDAPDDGGGGTG